MWWPNTQEAKERLDSQVAGDSILVEKVLADEETDGGGRVSDR